RDTVGVRFGTGRQSGGGPCGWTGCGQRPAPLSMSLNNLISKVLAAGLAAGVFLIWWPAHLPSTGVEWLVLRGLAWTLAFEILVLSFVPLEAMAGPAVRRRREDGRASRPRRRGATAPAPARARGAVMLAFTGLPRPRPRPLPP